MATVQTSMRLDEEQLVEAKKILSQLGLNFTQAVNIFTNMVVVNKGLPFEVKLPNEETVSVLREVQAGTGIEETSIDQLKESATSE